MDIIGGSGLDCSTLMPARELGHHWQWLPLYPTAAALCSNPVNESDGYKEIMHTISD